MTGEFVSVIEDPNLNTVCIFRPHLILQNFNGKSDNREALNPRLPFSWLELITGSLEEIFDRKGWVAASVFLAPDPYNQSLVRFVTKGRERSPINGLYLRCAF